MASPGDVKSHSWEAYGAWHLVLTEGAGDDTKARYAFVFGDFRRLRRSGLIACQDRAAGWRHTTCSRSSTPARASRRG